MIETKLTEERAREFVKKGEHVVLHSRPDFEIDGFELAVARGFLAGVEWERERIKKETPKA